MADDEVDRAPWQIKDVSVETRKLAVACAGNRGEKVGTWVERAVKLAANLESRDRVIPPDERLPAEQTGALVAPIPTVADLIALARLADAPGMTTAGRQARAILNAQLRAMRGLPPRKPGVNRVRIPVNRALAPPPSQR